MGRKEFLQGRDLLNQLKMCMQNIKVPFHSFNSDGIKTFQKTQTHI